MRFSTSSLAICKACSHSSVKDGFHQRSSCKPAHKKFFIYISSRDNTKLTKGLQLIKNSKYKPINHFICCTVIKGIIKAKGLILQVSGEVDLLFRLMDHHNIFTGDSDHIQLLCSEFYNTGVTHPLTPQLIKDHYRWIYFLHVQFMLFEFYSATKVLLNNRNFIFNGILQDISKYVEPKVKLGENARLQWHIMQILSILKSNSSF